MSELSLNREQRGFEYGVQHLLSPADGPLLSILAEVLATSLTEIQSLLALGAIYVEGERCAEDRLISKDTYVRVHTKPRRFLKNDFKWRERIIGESEDFVVVNKPSALPCHPSVDNTQENLLAYISEDLKQDFFLTHRLDVPTQGLLVLAKNKKFQSLFNEMLKERKLSKIYRAICVGTKPALGLHRHYMKPSPRAPKQLVLEPHQGFPLCELSVLSCEEMTSETSLVHLELHTGRTHQIRAQMSFGGAPVRGDHMYGAEKIYEDDRIDLTACELSFTNPRDGIEYKFKLP